MRKHIDFDRVASSIMFGNSVEQTIKDYGLRYRKGKGESGIHKALQKAYKNGMHRTEYELNMFSLYLRIDVFKAYSEVYIR